MGARAPNVDLPWIVVWDENGLDPNSPVPMRESRMETWVDIEMSIPSVLGLFSGADMLIRDMVTPLQSEMLIWFLALFLWLSPVNWRSLHWWNLRACENNWAHSKLQHSNFSATAYNSKDGSKNLHQWGHINFRKFNPYIYNSLK